MKTTTLIKFLIRNSFLHEKRSILKDVPNRKIEIEEFYNKFDNIRLIIYYLNRQLCFIKIDYDNSICILAEASTKRLKETLKSIKKNNQKDIAVDYFLSKNLKKVLRININFDAKEKKSNYNIF